MVSIWFKKRQHLRNLSQRANCHSMDIGVERVANWEHLPHGEGEYVDCSAELTKKIRKSYPVF